MTITASDDSDYSDDYHSRWLLASPCLLDPSGVPGSECASLWPPPCLRLGSLLLSIVTAWIRLWVWPELPWVSVLGLVHRVVVIDAWFLLYHLSPGAAAGHGTAEEDIDEEHDSEEHTKGDSKVSQPGWVGSTAISSTGGSQEGGRGGGGATYTEVEVVTVSSLTDWRPAASEPV